MGIMKNLKDMFRVKKQELAEATKVSSDKTIDFAIEDSKKMANDFRKKISTLNAQNKLWKRQAEEKKTKMKSLQEMASKAAEAGSVDDVKTILGQKNTIDADLTNLKKQIAINQKDIDSARAQVNKMTTQIKNAESSKNRLRVRKESASIRKSLAEASSSMGSGDNPLSQLDDLMEEVEQAEAEAEAVEEEVGLEPENVTESLEAKYADDGSADLDDEVAKMMAKAKGK
jgi:phage shock protein A